MSSPPNRQSAQQAAEPFVVPLKREKKAKRSVLIADRIADRIITIGGILVIIVVLGILVFLVKETLPLFMGGTITAHHDYELDVVRGNVLSLTMDEHKTIILVLSRDGTVTLFHARTGRQLEPPHVNFQGKQITSFSTTLDRRHLAFGFGDGAVRLAGLVFESLIIPADELPEELIRLDDRDLTDGSVVYAKIPGNQYRRLGVAIEWEEAVQIFEDRKPLAALAYRAGGEEERWTKAFVAIDGERRVTLNTAATRINLLTGQERTTVTRVELPPLPETLSIHSVILTERADAVLIADRSGIVYRYNTSNVRAPVLAEINRILPAGVEIGRAHV